MKSMLPRIYPHIIAIVLFLLCSIAYFPQSLENKTLNQSDVRNHQGMSKEILDYQQTTGKHTLWSNNMFGGMPGYLTSTPPSGNILLKFHNFLSLNHFRPVSFLFLLMLGFYILLLCLRINPYLGIIGAMAFAFSTNNLLLIEAGHLTKVMAFAYIGPVVGGIYLAYRKKILLGSILTAVALSIQLAINHLQITYYTVIIVVVFGIFELVRAFQQKQLPSFIRSTVVLLVAVTFAIATNLSNFWLTYEYSKYSMRGKSEITVSENESSKGLDPDYVTAWSYGIDETLTLLIPNFKGGASAGPVGENSETYKLFERAQGKQYAKQVSQHLPLYWGTQPFTGGPVYAGAGIFFLFILGLFLIKGPMKWWLLAVSVLAIMLSWGRNFMFLTNIFLEYVPMYNKFRDVTTLLLIVQFTFPILAIMVFHKLVNEDIKKEEFIKAFKYALYGTGGVTLFFVLLPGAFFDFSALSDAQYLNQGGDALVNALVADRKVLLRNDAIRSFIYVGLTAGLVWFINKKKIKSLPAAGICFLIILLDLVPVDKRYVNKDDFVPKRQSQVAFQPMLADQQILTDTSLYYRVFDLTADPFRSARASYFHKSIGGYHGAKLRRYQDIIERHLSRNNMDVINMLNTRYFIIPVENAAPQARYNGMALGNAWFVDQFRLVENADEEIAALDDFNPANEAIIDKRFSDQLEGFTFHSDSTANIPLVSYEPNRLVYKFESNTDQLTVFSEIYYEKGWEVKIDDTPATHFRVNYILRGMVIPAGKHTIDFQFQPKPYTVGRPICVSSSILLALMAVGIVLWEIRKYLNKEQTSEA